MDDGILQGLRVVEWGEFISAPYCTKLMADLGAEVIKVEKPGSGDRARCHGPFPEDISHPERSGLFLYLNAHKLGITLDPLTPTGHQLLRELLAKADVFVEDRPPSMTEELGLDYASLKSVCPRLIVTSITPFGRTGPYRDYRALDITCCALGGVSWAIGEPGREPLSLPLSQGQYQAGTNAAAASMAGLLAREKTGRGQLVDLSITDVLAFYAGTNALLYTPHGLRWHRAGRRAFGSGGRYPYTILPCKDGYICLIARARPEWERFLQAIGRPAWADDSRYQNRYRMGKDYPEEVDELLRPWLMERTKEEIFTFCRQHHIPFAPVRDIAEVSDDSHLATRGFFAEIEHPEAGRLKTPGLPYRFSGYPGAPKSPAPQLGEHNNQVYRHLLSHSREELAKWRRIGVI